MRPRHNRHPYKGTKFRKRYTHYQFMFIKWLQTHFLPKYLTKDGGPFRDPSRKTWAYKDIRKLYNAWYKRSKTEHKKNGGFFIGDQWWYTNK